MVTVLKRLIIKCYRIKTVLIYIKQIAPIKKGFTGFEISWDCFN